MRKYTYRTILPELMAMTAALLLTTACQQDESDASLQVPIRLCTSVGDNGTTRAAAQTHLNAAATNFAANQQVALFITEHDPSTGTEKAATTDGLTYTGQLHPMTTAVSDNSYTLGFAEAPATRYWPDSGNKLSFYAWYPYSATGPFAGQTAASTPTFTVAADQSSNATYAACDLLTARLVNQARSTSAQTLAFTHALSKIVVELRTDENSSITAAQLAAARVELTGTAQAPVYLSATVDIKGGTATYQSAGVTTESLLLGTGASQFAVLPPGQSLVGCQVSITIEGKTQSYPITTISSLVAGKKYTFTLELSSILQNYGQTLTVSIDPWETPDDNLPNPRLSL